MMFGKRTRRDRKQDKKNREKRRRLAGLMSRAPRLELLEDRRLLTAVHGQKFDDLDGNGVHDAGEPGLNGQTMYLFDSSGGLVETQVTMDMEIDGNPGIDPETERGLYWFTGLPDDTYTVGESLPAGWVQTDPPLVDPGVLQPGFDLFMTDPGSTFVDLPLDFFGGPAGQFLQVQLEGNPFFPGGVDTIVERLEPADVQNVGEFATVEIELVALQLQSVQPVDIQGTLFDVQVIGGSNSGIPQQPGQMTINREHEFGGTFNSELPVQAELTFTEVGNPTNQFQVPFQDLFVLDPLNLGSWAIEPAAGDPRLVDPTLSSSFPSGGFFPGVDHPDDCLGTKVLTQEEAMLAAHGVLPAMIAEAVAPGVKQVIVAGGVPVLDVKFGNAAKGSIHGYKFEDLDLNGVDESEPRLAGVEITLTGTTGLGRSIGPITTTTDGNGEYGFTKLTPGVYTVTETRPVGFIPTTPISRTVDLLSHQELVAEVGQSGVPSGPDDPRVEVLVGATLMFGNAQLDADFGDAPDAANDIGVDLDGDGVDNELDNAPYQPNPGQEDADGDGVGAVADPDDFEADIRAAVPGYPTRLVDGGAGHQAIGPRLGLLRDTELDGQPNEFATGDDLAVDPDEDGVTLLTSLIRSSTSDTTAMVEVDLQNAPDAALDAWLDLNFDGNWDASEQIFASQPLMAGLNPLSFTIAAGSVTGQTYARFRVSSAGGLGPDGLALNGEVEDYAYFIEWSANANPVVDLPEGGGGFRVVRDGDDVVVISDMGTELFRAPATGPDAISSLTVNGSDNDDTLTVDLSGGPSYGTDRVQRRWQPFHDAW